MELRLATQRLLSSGVLSKNGLKFVKEAPVDKGGRGRVIVKDKYGELNCDTNNLLRDYAPTIVTAVNKTEYIINKFKDIHGDLYDYSYVKYVGTTDKVCILCPTHGKFYQSTISHINGHGCRACSTLVNCDRRRSNTQEFIDKAKRIHGNTYTYSNTEYRNSSTKVSITCPIHGDFLQKPNAHLSGKGCRKCADVLVADRSRGSLSSFIEKATQIHGSTYDYSAVNYVDSKTKVEIICPIHGSFLQTVGNHLSGCGCKRCAMEHTTWTYTDWEAAGNNSKYFDAFKVYIIKCWNAHELFYKIGKTFVNVNKRFSGKEQIPYNWEVLKMFTGNAKDMSELEQYLHKKHTVVGLQYTPNIGFGGSTECFSKIIKD